MGGGLETPSAEEVAAHQVSVSGLLAACQSATYTIIDVDSKSSLEESYRRVDKALVNLSDSAPFVVVKTAAHVEIVGLLRVAANRYKELEVSTTLLVEQVLRLATSLAVLMLPMSPPLHANAQGARAAMQAAIAKLSSIHTITLGAASAHRAVSRDVDAIAAKAGAVAADPSASDAGFIAAPILGGAAAASVFGLLLRGFATLCLTGPAGILGALAVAGLGALGTQGIAASAYPLIAQRFHWLQDEVALVSSAMMGRAALLEALASDIGLAHSQLVAALDVAPDGSEASHQLREEILGVASAAFDAIAFLATSCRYRTSAFLIAHLEQQRPDGIDCEKLQ